MPGVAKNPGSRDLDILEPVQSLDWNLKPDSTALVQTRMRISAMRSGRDGQCQEMFLKVGGDRLDDRAPWKLQP